jgi:LacI family transcriptional regulator
MRAKGNVARQSKASRPTLRHVAERAHVSVMTVSNVVNERNQFVGVKTRERVQKAIRELNYHPSATSRKLRGMQDFTIGVVIADDEPAFLKDPFITEIVAGLGNQLSAQGYSLSIQGVRPDQVSKAVMFSSVGTDGICAILCGSEATRRRNVEFLLTLRQPVVLFQETLEIDSPHIAVVSQDDHEGGREIARHVIGRGARNLLFLRPSMEWPAISERCRGIRAAIKESRSGVRLTELECPHEGFAETQSALGRYLAAGKAVDAILGGNDRLAIAAMRYCQDRDIDVPGKMKVTGFNGFDSWRYTKPELTTIVSPAHEMGQLAGRMLLKHLRAGTFARRKVLVPVRFQAGGSA